MATSPRNFKKGGIYHLIKRGVGPQEVFKDKQDYSRCSLSLEFCNCVRNDVNLWELITGNTQASPEDTLEERLRREREEEKKPLVGLLAFALMPTHIHLLAREIKEGGISKYMQKLGGYSRYFNGRHNRHGTLFPRYESVEIRAEAQLKIIFNYIHTNPVEIWEPGWKEFQVENPGKAFKKLLDYPWTSLGAYIGQDEFLKAIDRDFYLDFLGGKEGCKKSVQEWIDYKAVEEEIERSKYEL